MRALLILAIPLLILAGPLAGQDKKASVLLSSAIYEEEVSGNLDKAIELYLGILKTYPDDRPVAAKALYHLGVATEKLGSEKAGEYYIRLINNYPEQKVVVELAKAKLAQRDLISSGKTHEAERHFNDAREMFKQWEYELAIMEFDNVIKLLPYGSLSQNAKYWKGMAYFKSGDYDNALTSFRTLISDNPESVLVPVSEIMITQATKAKSDQKNKSAYLNSGNGTIIDPINNITYRKVSTVTGKNDIVTHPFQINSIDPKGRFFITDKLLVHFDASESHLLFDLSDFRTRSYSILSPDATKVAFYTDNALEMITLSSETGQPVGVAKKLLDEKYIDDYETFINWSPDGKKLVFLRNENDSIGDLWTLGIDDGKLTRITDTPDKKWSPSFSNDGKNILYGTRNLERPADPNKVWVCPADGGTPKVIIDTFAYSLTGLQWSPDHNWIVYRTNADHRKRFMYNMKNGKSHEMIPPQEVGTFVFWSPDGKKMLFYKPSFKSRRIIKVVSVYGGPTVELGSRVDIKGRPYWSPDNQAIVTTGLNKKGKPVFWVLSIDNDDPTEIEGIPSMHNLSFSSVSPDYKNLLSTAYNDVSKSFELGVRPFSWREAAVTGPLKVILHDTKRRITNCSWSPDGFKIALSYQGDIWICNMEGVDPVRFTATPDMESFPNWSPDGTMIAIHVRTNSSSSLKIFNSSDGQLIRIIDNYDVYAWSPDSKEIAIGFTDRLSAVSIQTGESRSILDWKALDFNALYDLSWSPDGKNIACIAYKDGDGIGNHIYRIRADGSGITELATDDDGEKVASCWSPNSKWISYSSSGIRKVRLEGTLWETDAVEFLKKMAR